MKSQRTINLVFGMAAFCFALTILAVKAKAADMHVSEIHTSDSPVVTVNEPVIDEDAHDVIRNQLGAIRDRDADQAFSMTSDTFHEKYETAGDFLGTLRFEFRPLYNHKHFSFTEQNHIGSFLLQKVEVEDEYGKESIILYRLVLDDGGHWVIDAVSMIEAESQPI